MPLVKSKYKNPDKHIESLKEKLGFKQCSVDILKERVARARGRHWFSCADGSNKEVVHTTYELMGAKLNQPIVILGYIVGYKKEGPDKHRVTISLKNVAMKDGN